MRSRVPNLLRRCRRCYFPPAACLCPFIPKLATATRVVFVRHAAERVRTTNTGRWAALALERSEVLEHAVAGAPLDLSRLAGGDSAAVLFPSGATRPLPLPPPATLVVPDGTWAQARRMLQRIPALRALPRFSLPERPGDRLRRPTVSQGMSTLEAVAAALEALGEGGAAKALLELHLLAVARGRALRWPSRPGARGPGPSAAAPLPEP